MRLSTRLLPGLLALLTVGAWARVARADEAPTRPEQHESDAKPPPSVRAPTIIGGLGLTTAFYGLGVGTSELWSDQPAMHYLRVPVAGPWLSLHHTACFYDPCNGYDVARVVWFVFDGLAQAGGVAVALEGLLVPTQAPGTYAPAPRPAREPVRVRPDEGPSRPSPEDLTPERSPTPPTPSKGPLFYLPRPMPVGASGYGFGVFGVF